MQLVVPMAGLGRRFSEVGFELPKPLISVDGVPMVVRAVWELPAADTQIFVVHAEHVERFQIDDVLRQFFPECHIVVTPVVTEGQACTVQLSGRELDSDDSVLVAACDNSHLYDNDKFERLTTAEQYDCLIWTYRHDSRVLLRPEAHGWVQTRGNTLDVESISCKRSLSSTPREDHAISGCFWFRSARQMLDAIDEQVSAGERIGREYYLDVTPNVLLRRGSRVGVFEVEKYIGWGTPEDLEDYDAGADISPPEGANWSEIEETRRQLRRFLVVGLLCVATDLAIYVALTRNFGLSIHWSKAFSYLAGVAVGFVLNKMWTFQSTRRTWSEPISYLALYLITLAVNVGCNNLVLAWIADQWLLAVLFATGVTTVLNFLGMKLVTFRKGIEERREIALELFDESTAA